MDYVGLYPNCVEVPTQTSDYQVFTFYDKLLIVSALPIHYHKFSVLSQSKYNYFAIEIDAQVKEDLKLDSSFAEFDDNVRFIIDSIIGIIEEKELCVKDSESNVVSTNRGDTILDNGRYEHYFMKYLKIKTENYTCKFDYIQFFKLSDDYIELLEV